MFAAVRNSPEPIAPEKRHLLIGHSPRIRHIARMVEKVGGGRWPVLLLGETGTGKEVVARAIHATKPSEPFVTIDCSSMVGPLMESELFGHAKGSFTGAASAKIGLIEHANGGTAFFDEIGELPLDLQSKLLRVLQEKEFRPVGSLATRRSDFRVIAATNRDLAKEVERGTFRRDLYFRLNVVSLRLAPLRERREDIPVLMQHFLTRLECTHTFTQEALEALLSYDWPGNVRELENCLQHMVAMNSGPLLHVTDLPSSMQNFLHIRNAQSLKSLSMSAAAGGSSALAGLDTASLSALSQGNPSHAEPEVAAPDISTGVLPLVEVERRHIMRALEYTKGDRAVAANLLGIGRTTLYRKLKEYEVAC